MMEEYKPVSKASIIVSTIFGVLNLILTIIYAFLSILALPIAFNPNPGTEGLGLAIAIVYMLIIGAAMIVLGLISTLTAIRYNNLASGSSWAKFLIIYNTTAVVMAILVYGIILLKI